MRQFKSVLLSLLFSSLFSVGMAQDNIVDEIVWVIGDETILRSDVEQQRIRSQIEGEKINGDPYCVIPEQLALTKLFLDQAKIDSITVDEKTVNSQADMRINYMVSQIGSKEKLEEYFKKPMDEIREELREMVETQQYVQQVQNKIVGDIKSTPAEIRRYVSKLSEDSLPDIPAQLEVQILSIAPNIEQSAIEEVKAQLRDYQDRIASGTTSFSTLALFYSEDVESGKRGGELGFMGRGQLVKEYADVAFAMYEPGKVSKIVESEFGFHIIQLIERRDERINTRHILLKPKPTAESMKAAKERIDSIMTAVNEKKFITFEQAVELYSTDKNTRNCSGILTNMQTGNSKFELQDLPQEVGRAVYVLNEGEISRPFLMLNSSGRQVYTVAKVKSKIPAHKANMKDDFVLLKRMYEEHKRQEILSDWIKKKQKEVYVRIDPNWRNCQFEYEGWVK
ncbi:MAG: peptidylprolyl isomerase [Paludibacteraceae bacterium]|nr:peptidylprolyl isomerase [Paludibacteraceae bacterium]